MKRLTFPPVTVLSVCYSTCGYWTYERIKRGFEGCVGKCRGKSKVDGGMKGSLGPSPQEVKSKLSFCCRPRRFARVGGCSNSSDKRAQVTRSSAFWSPTGSDCTCKTRQGRWVGGKMVGRKFGLSKEKSAEKQKKRKTNTNIYSGFKKYLDHFSFSTLCCITKQIFSNYLYTQ